MVDPISNNSSVNSLLRAQLSSSVSGLKANQQSAQTLVTQLQKTAAPVKSTSITQTSKSLGRTGNAPRGTFLDILA